MKNAMCMTTTTMTPSLTPPAQHPPASQEDPISPNTCLWSTWHLTSLSTFSLEFPMQSQGGNHKYLLPVIQHSASLAFLSSNFLFRSGLMSFALTVCACRRELGVIRTHRRYVCAEFRRRLLFALQVGENALWTWYGGAVLSELCFCYVFLLYRFCFVWIMIQTDENIFSWTSRK